MGDSSSAQSRLRDHRRDAYALEPGKRYLGHVLDTVPTRTHSVELKNATWEEFNSEELEDLPGDFRLTHA
jgi:hypothetical protein